MTADPLPDVLRRADAGERVADIAEATGLTSAKVYAILREKRPRRQRSPRTRTSTKRLTIVGLLSCGHKANRVHKLIGASLGVSRQYVHRVAKEEQTQ